METVVADTSALVSLAIPKAAVTYDTTSEPDPLGYLLAACTVTVPGQVDDELREMAGYDDVHAAAATNVLAADSHYRSLDPLERENTPDSIPDWGLDVGETAGIVLANAIGVDAFLTDEFTNLARIRALLDETMAIPTPRLLRDYARSGELETEQARALFSTIAPHRSWEGNAYVEAIRRSL